MSAKEKGWAKRDDKSTSNFYDDSAQKTGNSYNLIEDGDEGIDDDEDAIVLELEEATDQDEEPSEDAEDLTIEFEDNSSEDDLDEEGEDLTIEADEDALLLDEEDEDDDKEL
jgi:hypothetical protein